MPHLAEVPADQTTGETQTLLDEIRGVLGFEPSFFKIIAWSPSLLRSVWRLERDVLLGGRLPRGLKERVMIAVAHEMRCDYCEAVHRVIAIDLGLRLEDIDTALAAASAPALDDPEAAVLRFATRFSRSARSVRDEDFTALRAHGYDDADVGEIVALSTLCSWLATLAVGLGMEIDPVIAERLRGNES